VVFETGRETDPQLDNCSMAELLWVIDFQSSFKVLVLFRAKSELDKIDLFFFHSYILVISLRV
jgi:hypothetical protein